MKSYRNFIGIDISKETFVVAVHGEKTTKEYANNSQGIDDFIKEKNIFLSTGLCVVETTGGYEMRLLLSLCAENFSIHRAHARQVKNFIRSYGNEAKTDIIDSRSLARYGKERQESLQLFVAPSQNSLQLYELVQRRRDLKKMMTAEKNRLQSPRVNCVKNSIEQMISTLEKSLEVITIEIDKLVNEEKILKEKRDILMTVPGIGKIISNELLILLPELGQLTRREIASLAGVAPIARDSGKLSGYRNVGHGRNGLKPILFLAAMAARNSKSPIRDYYEKLIARGKKKMVALTAVMRKIIVIANARLKEAKLA